ncbi:MAG: GFA family protein [Rhodospirillaceae bacterium]|nr:GFA family protein [Rhodospirillaceae bacterium]
MNNKKTDKTGSCLCGAVAFIISGDMRNIVACHCGQCQRTHGHYAAYSRCQLEDLSFTEDRGLKWYRSSENAERGFCGECGASIFWRPTGGDAISVAAGSLDSTGDLKLVGHIFCDDIPDYYSLEDDLPKYPGSSKGGFD